MSSVSVVIISLNEGELLRLTVNNILATLPPQSEIIVVNDGSTDGSTDFLSNGDAVTLLRPSERLGVARARNFGAQHASGDVVVFSDAHVTAPVGWCEALMDLVARPEIGAAAPAISMMQSAGSAGYGQKWVDASLAVEWLGCQKIEPYAVPLLCGCFLDMRRKLFAAVGEFDGGMVLWGAEDSELSIRLWTLGYECCRGKSRILKDTQFQTSRCGSTRNGSKRPQSRSDGRPVAAHQERWRAPDRLDIVIPCHNYARYLGEAIESVLANDADYEIQIVDDASSDETPSVAASFVRRYPHIHYLRNEERHGTGYSRNRGIAARESDFVVLLDADDRIGSNYLFEAGRKLANGVDVVNPDAVLFGARQDRWNVPEGTTLAMLLEQNSVHCTSAFRRQFWSQTGGFDEQIPFWEDYEFWIRLGAAGAKIQGLHGDHFFYCTHVGSKTETSSRIQPELRRYLREKHAHLYAKFNAAAQG